MPSQVITHTNFENMKLIKQGKVREIYDLDEHFLIVTTDRLSAFDVIMNQGIPDKGNVLNLISCFWFNLTKNIIQNHLVTADVNEYPDICKPYTEILKNRSMLVKKAELIPIECIVRGYISGSGWNDYKKSGSICGIKLPEGLVDSEKLPEPIFTPSTKADLGTHDENISEEQAIKIIGVEAFQRLRNVAIGIYKQASEYALTKGIIIADTKMEFGYLNGEIILIDELLTPDSSRFWPIEEYEKGRAQNSFDKQYVRDYLLSIKFNKMPPAPELPESVINNTSRRYREALEKLTGTSI